jgi:general secretion pathway protein B
MSLILDALKKSENERQRQGQPAMFEIKVAPPRARFPAWAVLVGLLLGINLIVLLVVLLLRDPPEAPARPPAAAQGTQPPPAPAPAAPSPGTATPVAAAPVAAAPVAGAAAGGLASRFNPPLVEDPELDAEPDAELAGTAAAPGVFPPARTGGGVVAGLPDRAALVASGTPVPEVNVSLHAWDRNPAARFVFIDGARASEGTALPSGLRVEQITPEGTVLSWRGSRFLVPIQ